MMHQARRGALRLVLSEGLYATRSCSSLGGGSSMASRSGASSAGKKPEQLTEEELKAALPSMMFTAGNLVWTCTSVAMANVVPILHH